MLAVELANAAERIGLAGLHAFCRRGSGCPCNVVAGGNSRISVQCAGAIRIALLVWLRLMVAISIAIVALQLFLQREWPHCWCNCGLQRGAIDSHRDLRPSPRPRDIISGGTVVNWCAVVLHKCGWK